MTDLREAAQQALKSLRGYRREINCEQPCDAERALEAALTEEALQRLTDANQEIEAVLEQEPEAAAELRRMHAVNQELGAALRRLISYCNTLENRLMEADGEHPALQEAKEAYAKVEGQV